MFKWTFLESDSFTSDHRRFLARMVVTAEPPEVTTCRTPAYLLLPTDSPPTHHLDNLLIFGQFLPISSEVRRPTPNYALCDQGIIKLFMEVVNCLLIFYKYCSVILCNYHCKTPFSFIILFCEHMLICSHNIELYFRSCSATGHIRFNRVHSR